MLWLLAIFVLFLTSCDDSHFDSSELNVTNVSQNFIEQEAVSFAKNVLNDGKTRASSSITAKTVISIPLNITRASNLSSLSFYAVPLNQQKGTVLVGVEDSTAFSLAYFQDENEFNVNEILSDSVSDFSFILQNLLVNIKPMDDIETNHETGAKKYEIERVSPKCLVSWRQDYPYNKYCFTKDGQSALAGCVAIAGAQALTVLRPTMSQVTSWDNLVVASPSFSVIDEIAHLIAYIGQETGMHYGTEASGTKTSNLVPLFAKYNIINYSGNDIDKVLKTKHGVAVISGYQGTHGWGPWKHAVRGHAFLADGFIKYNYGTFLHLNYGWGSRFTDKAKNAYVLNVNKSWDEDSAKSVYGEVFKYSVKFYPFTYANEKFWK